MNPVRQAALALLPEVRGVFLRCDRGNSLYVTNAPALTDEKIDFESAGFIRKGEKGLIFLTPGEEWAERIKTWLETRVPVQSLSCSMGGPAFGSIRDEDMLLLIEGIKALEMYDNARDYEKKVRQRAAVCLREKQGGGTLRVCALMVDYLNGGGNTDED